MDEEDKEENTLALLADLVHIEIGRREKRPHCNRCRRPTNVCWCSSLGSKRINTKCKVVVFQHPHEEKRCLRTAPILQAALPQGNYLEVKGKRFNSSRFPDMCGILCDPNSILMYPGEDASDVESLPPVGELNQPPYNLIIIDGTWQQAKSMYHNSPQLQKLRQVCLSGKYVSEYVIRTQPTNDALSTVESAAIALAILEQNWSIYATLVGPLQTMCQHQLMHGAVPHQSKEFLILSGRYKKPVGKRTLKLFCKSGLAENDLSESSTSNMRLMEETDINKDNSTSVVLDLERDYGFGDNTTATNNDFGDNTTATNNDKDLQQSLNLCKFTAENIR